MRCPRRGSGGCDGRLRDARVARDRQADQARVGHGCLDQPPPYRSRNLASGDGWWMRGVDRWELAGPQDPVRWLPAPRLPGQARRSAAEDIGPGRRGRASFLVDDLRQPVELDGRSTSDSTRVAALAGATTTVNSGCSATIHAATIERGSTRRPTSTLSFRRRSSSRTKDSPTLPGASRTKLPGCPVRSQAGVEPAAAPMASGTT